MRALPPARLAALPLLSMLACAGPSLYAKAAHRVPQRPVVAVVPVMAEHGALVDTALSAAFATSERHTLVSIAALRERIRSDEPLRRRLARVAEVRVRTADGARAPGLTDLLGDDDLLALRTELGGADLLVFPVEWATRAGLGRTAAVMTYRVYDLADGSLLLQNTARFEVDRGGDEGVILAALAFSGATYRDWARHVMGDPL